MSKKYLTLPNNIELQVGKGVVYSLMNRYDASAPDGLRELGTTKLPNASGVDHLKARYNEDYGEGIYDTGLYSESPILSSLTQDQADTLTSELEELVVKPIERKLGKGVLKHTGISKHWDNYSRELVAGKRYHMDSPEDILELYLAVIYGHVVPKGSKDMHSMDASFEFINKESEISIENEKRRDRMKATRLYMKLMDSKDTEKVEMVFEYLRLPVIKTKKGLHKDAMDVAFERNSEGDNSYEFNKKFKEVAGWADSRTKIHKLRGYSKLRALVKEGIVVRGTIDNVYRLGELELGMSIEEASDLYEDNKNNPEIRKMVDLTYDDITKKNTPTKK